MSADFFAGMMIATFIAALIALAMGIGKMGGKTPSSRFMLLRVVLCFALLGEILIYVTYFK